MALNHTAGPVAAAAGDDDLFSLYELMDTKKHYQKACMEIVNQRVKAMIEGLGLERPARTELHDTITA